MPVGESDRGRVAVEIRQADRPPSAHHLADQPTARGEMRDPGGCLVAQTVEEERLKAPLRIRNADGRIGRAGQLARGVNDPSQCALQRQIAVKAERGPVQSTHPGFAGIGQTWSFPNVARIKGVNSGNDPVIVIGGGYDACEDDNSASPPCSSPKGNEGDEDIAWRKGFLRMIGYKL